jgi:hypothetical protein
MAQNALDELVVNGVLAGRHAVCFFVAERRQDTLLGQHVILPGGRNGVEATTAEC